RQRTWWLNPLIFLAVVAAGAVALCFTVFRPKLVTVTVQRVETGRVEDSVVNSRAGTVQSRLRSEMSPGIAGLVVAIPARKGTHVKKGDVLLRVDDTEQRARVQVATRTLDAARAVSDQTRLEAEHAERQWKRTQELVRNQVVSETAFDVDRTQAQTTQAALT